MHETLEDIAKKFEEKKGNTIFLLQETQEALGYIPKEAVDFYSTRLGIPSSRIFGVATFYAQFRMKPTGKNTITACCGTACHVKGAERIINGIRRELKLSDGEDTTSDLEFTLEQVNCVGACSIAPVCIVNKKVFGKTASEKMIREIRTLKGKSSDEE